MNARLDGFEEMLRTIIDAACARKELQDNSICKPHLRLESIFSPRQDHVSILILANS